MEISVLSDFQVGFYSSEPEIVPVDFWSSVVFCLSPSRRIEITDRESGITQGVFALVRRDLCRVWPQLADPEPVAPDKSRKRQQVIVVLKDMQARGPEHQYRGKAAVGQSGDLSGLLGVALDTQAGEGRTWAREQFGRRPLPELTQFDPFLTHRGAFNHFTSLCILDHRNLLMVVRDAFSV